jgi:hypothetical protein
MTHLNSKYVRAYLERQGKVAPEAVAAPVAPDVGTLDPSKAEGADLDALVELTGLEREPSVQDTGPLPAVTDVSCGVCLDGKAPSPVIGEAQWTCLACGKYVGQPATIKATFTSSNIREAELEVATGVLTVTFANGGRYRYGNFTPLLMTAWQEAKSAGGWFHHVVKMKPSAHPVIAETPAPTAEVTGATDHVE